MTIESARNIDELRAQQAERAIIPESTATPLDFHSSTKEFDALMLAMIGTKTAQAIADYFGPPISPQTVKDWRRGRTGVPKWVVEKTRQRLSLLNASIAKITPGPGPARNIWLNYGPKRKSPVSSIKS